MSEKATAGFAGLRAKFENKNDESPPSRGRSPTGQENVKGSGRKIRTSFVSVERIGQMSPSLDQRESMGSNEDQTSVTEGAKDPKAGMNVEDENEPKTNGVAAASEKQEERLESRNEQASPDLAKKLGNGTLELEEATNTDAINPDKPAAAEEDDTSSMLPSDPKDEDAVSGGAALAPKGESLGTLLKGSDFEAEKESSKKSSPRKSPQKSPKKATAPSNPSTPTKKTRGSPKSTPAKAVGTPNVNGSPRVKSATSRPSTISKPQASPAAKPPETSSPAAKDTNAPASETASASPIASKPSLKQPREKPASPRQHTPKQQTQPGDAPKSAEKERQKPTIPKPSRLSTSTKATQSARPATSKPNGAAATGIPNRSGPRSPNAVKPKPKSPTRPVRLPGAATASTASSSAKTGSTMPPRPESRASTANPSKPSTLNKATGAKAPPRPTAANIRTKAPRSSLPASTLEQKPKPKPRTSIASTKAPGNDFLSRMMRPTASSASKTHEKVEQKTPPTPPKKRISARPKRISDESGAKAESKAVEAKPDSMEQGTEQGEQAVNHIESDNRQENAAPVPTEEAFVEETAEPDGNTLTSTNENTVAAS
ncbi:MAG: hypothetical protein L6R38_006796 [Xanthoria sp. 2 TBL-2021]|nr:MAG: hypothetical protein L6R38_006796 [Xanthoria sp. 2 TBL-2021]